MSKCKCGYQRIRKQRVKGSECPGCGHVERSFCFRLKRACNSAYRAFWRAFQVREYQPRVKRLFSQPMTDEELNERMVENFRKMQQDPKFKDRTNVMVTLTNEL